MSAIKKIFIKRIQKWMETANSSVIDFINWRMQNIHNSLDKVDERIRLQSLKLDLNNQTILYNRWMKDPNTILDRREFGYWLNFLGVFGQGVEVGVFQGDYSRILLDTWKGSILHSIDPWMSFDKNRYVDMCNVNDTEQEKNFQITRDKLNSFGPRSNVIRTTSRDASATFEAESLAFVYLDAQHHYEAVVEDISFWYPKIKRGGIISGHDYLNGRINGSEFGVKSAVDEFAERNSLHLLVTQTDPYPSWFAKKCS